MNEKLIKVTRTINTYNCNDNILIEEIGIDYIPLTELKKIVEPKEGDTMLCDGYILSDSQIKKINHFLQNKIIPNFDLYFYVLEAAGIYDWEIV